MPERSNHHKVVVFYPHALTGIPVIVRRVVEARRAHASGAKTNSPRFKSQAHNHSASQTQPLTPLDEKAGSVDFARRPGKSTKRSGFLAKFKCW